MESEEYNKSNVDIFCYILEKNVIELNSSDLCIGDLKACIASFKDENIEYSELVYLGVLDEP